MTCESINLALNHTPLIQELCILSDTLDQSNPHTKVETIEGVVSLRDPIQILVESVQHLIQCCIFDAIRVTPKPLRELNLLKSFSHITSILLTFPCGGSGILIPEIYKTVPADLNPKIYILTFLHFLIESKHSESDTHFETSLAHQSP